MFFKVQGFFEDSGRYSRVAGVAVRAAADLFIVDVTKPSSVRPRFQNCESFELTVKHDSKDPHATFEVSSRLFNCDSDITLLYKMDKHQSR